MSVVIEGKRGWVATVLVIAGTYYRPLSDGIQSLDSLLNMGGRLIDTVAWLDAHHAGVWFPTVLLIVGLLLLWRDQRERVTVPKKRTVPPAEPEEALSKGLRSEDPPDTAAGISLYAPILAPVDIHGPVDVGAADRRRTEGHQEAS